MKRVIRLTENDLHKIVKNSVKRILKEERSMKSAMIRKLYRALSKSYISRTIKFDYFNTVKEMVQYINNIEGIKSAYLNDDMGEKGENSSGDKWVEFTIFIELENGEELTLVATCNIASSVKDENYPIYYVININIY